MKTYPAAMPWLIVRLKSRTFALPTQEVRELVIKPHITVLPETRAGVLGVINIRGRVLPVIDLRTRLGMNPASEENESFRALMDQRRQDHVNWLHELENSTRERREFKLATDPHQCAFGRWYDNYKPENVWIGALLRRFGSPHQEIHRTAVQVLALRREGQFDEAMAFIESVRGGVLAEMIKLFESLQELIRESYQQIVVVLETEQHTFGVSVDEAVAVEKFERENLLPMPLGAERGVAAQCGRREKSELVLMLATERLLSAA